VHRDTFSRWETGAIEIPTRKLQMFLRLVEVDPRDIPKRPEPLQYDSKGYPVGFDSKRYEESRDWDDEEKALRKIEGDKFESREAERARLRDLSDYEDEEENYGSACNYTPVARFFTPEGLTAVDELRWQTQLFLAWKRDPEGMARRYRLAAARERTGLYPHRQWETSEFVEAVIRQILDLSREMPEDATEPPRLKLTSEQVARYRSDEENEKVWRVVNKRWRSHPEIYPWIYRLAVEPSPV
jgi:hypothetical protein